MRHIDGQLDPKPSPHAAIGYQAGFSRGQDHFVLGSPQTRNGIPKAFLKDLLDQLDTKIMELLDYKNNTNITHPILENCLIDGQLTAFRMVQDIIKSLKERDVETWMNKMDKPDAEGSWWYEKSDYPIIVRRQNKYVDCGEGRGFVLSPLLCGMFRDTWIPVTELRDGWWIGPLVKPKLQPFGISG